MASLLFIRCHPVQTTVSAQTVSSIYGFFLEMVRNPEAQKTAQAELDLVLGGDGKILPTLSDRSRLPYVEALVKEVFRCGVVAPMSVIHRLSADDLYMGYNIPKGSLILTNIWYQICSVATYRAHSETRRFMLHDHRRYKDPHRFDPTRFLGPSPEPDPRSYVFGFGRRQCPGASRYADRIIITAHAATIKENYLRRAPASSPSLLRLQHCRSHVQKTTMVSRSFLKTNMKGPS
jgi:cytochrome P450